jgi:transposase
MPRVVQLGENFMREDFRERLRKCKDGFLSRRLIAFEHLQQGATIKEAAAKACSSTVVVQQWLKAYRERGSESLQRRGGSGRVPLLNAQQLLTFKENFMKAAAAREGGRLTGKDVQVLLSQQLGGRTVGKTAAYRWLHRAGLSWVTGRDIHPKADIQAQEAFKKTSEIKSNCASPRKLKKQKLTSGSKTKRA